MKGQGGGKDGGATKSCRNTHTEAHSTSKSGQMGNMCLSLKRFTSPEKVNRFLEKRGPSYKAVICLRCQGFHVVRK